MARKMTWAADGVLGMLLLVAGCGDGEREATQAAINAAQTAMNAVEQEAAKYVPEQWQAAQSVLQSAKDALAKGDYQAALRAAQDAANKAKDLAAAAAAKKDQWTKEWSDMNASLPKSMDAVKAKLDAYAKSGRLPPGMDKDQMAEAKTQYEQLKQRWVDAAALAAQGKMGEAIEKATGIKEVLEKMKDLQGIKA